MSARVEKLVGMASLQGQPISGYRRYGVPTGGAFDQESFLLGNALLGNPPDALAIELSNAAVEIVFSVGTRVAIVGASAPNSAFDVAVGETVPIEAPKIGLRSYVCVAGGWIPDGVESTLGRAGRILQAGDVLQHEERTGGTVERLANPVASLDTGLFRVIVGPQPLVRFSESAGVFRVSNSSDRTGIRLDGLPPREVPEFTSEPACVGAIQLTSSGQLIIIGPDGPTIGGYPKVAVVCGADLDRLAHLRPGQEVAFEEVHISSARELAAERRAKLSATLSQIKIARSGLGF